MQQKHIIPISDPKIENLFNLWVNNGFEKEEEIDINKALLKGSEKDLHQINLYSIEHQKHTREFLGAIRLENQKFFLSYVLISPPYLSIYCSSLSVLIVFSI